MYELAVYNFKAGVCLAAFYLFFKLLMSRETLHSFNRFLILGAISLSFILPLCVITVYRELPVTPALPAAEATIGTKTAALASMGSTHTKNLLGALFISGVAVTLCRTLWSLVCVVRIVRRGRHETLPDGTVAVRTDNVATPFSWGRYIVLPETEAAASDTAILVHEQAHRRRLHSIDLLITDFAVAFQWFNPAMWLLRRELRAIHEYEADEAVLNSGVNAQEYQLLLIKKAVGGRWYSIANSFHHNKLKNRITMMLRKKSSKWAHAKSLFLIPMTAIALTAFSQTVYTTRESENLKITGNDTLRIQGQSDSVRIYVDGKRTDCIDSIPVESIASVSILKGESARKKYPDMAENETGVMEISLRNPDEISDKGTPLSKTEIVIVEAKSEAKSK